MSEIRINLYSDTQTRPSTAMREAMMAAPVGDEQRGADPTTDRLQERVAALLGKEAAVFLPSGTMANEISILIHCRPGDEIIADKTAHILNFEGGGPAAFAGAQIRPLEGERGLFTPEQAEAAIRFESRYDPRSRLVSLEQTANMGGGTVWPLAQIEAVAAVARGRGLAVHMDGARLLNAVAASGTAAQDFAAAVDSVWIDLSKGLGCPVGAVLAGSKEFIAEAWRWKQRMGGALRQSGILAAAGLYALDHNVARLTEDHANARLLAERVAEIPRLAAEPAAVESNIMFFDVVGTGRSAQEISGALAAQGVMIGAAGPSVLRAVTHLDVTRDQVQEAAEILAQVIGNG